MMGRLIARPKKAAHDFGVSNGVPRASVALAVGMGPDPSGGGSDVEYRGFIQFPIRLSSSAVVSAATLRLVCKGAGPASVAGAVHLVALWSDSGVTLDGAWTAASVASAAFTWPAMAEGGVVEVDVTAIVAAALAHGGYTNGIITLRVQSSAPAGFGTLYAADDQWSQGPRLTIDFTWSESDVDPYTLCMDALWALLESNPQFAALVAPSNRIKIDGSSRDTRRDTLNEGDLPEVTIVLAGGTPHEKATSSSAFDVAKYQIFVATGDQRPSSSYHKVRWAIFRALANWTSDICEMVKWRGKRIIIQAYQAEVSEAIDSDENRGIRGLTCVWECELRLAFAESDLL